MQNWIACFFALSFACGVAGAADLEPQAVPVEPTVFNWSGPYLGISGGYGWLEDADYAFSPPLRSSGEDWVLGLHAGYMHQFGSLVAGVEGDIARLDINFEGFPIDAESSYAVKARAGYAIGRTLLSGHAGAVYATTNIGLEDWGWIAGAGIDYAVTDNFVAGVSYDHMGFERFDGTAIDASLDLLRMRLSFKF